MLLTGAQLPVVTLPSLWSTTCQTSVQTTVMSLIHWTNTAVMSITTSNNIMSTQWVPAVSLYGADW